MKKLVMGLLIISCLVTFMTGCVEKEPKETAKIDAAAEEDTNEASQKVFDEFTKLLETKDALQTKEFILDNIQKVTQEIADKMVVQYEVFLNTNFFDLAEKYNSGTYFDAINETMDDQYVLNLEKIKNENIKEEVMNVVALGYTFEMLEGSYYLTIDYAMIHDTFSHYLSESLKPYYELRKKDVEQPTFVEEYVNIDFEEIKSRVTTLERVIRDNKEFAARKDIRDLMKWHINALLTVSYFNKVVDYDTGKVEESVKKTYEELKESDLKISKYAAEEMDKLLTQFEYVLKQDDDEAYEKVNSLKFKITDEVEGKIDEYYLAK